MHITIRMITEKLGTPPELIQNIIPQDHVSTVRIRSSEPLKENILYLEVSNGKDHARCVTKNGSSFFCPGDLCAALNTIMEAIEYYAGWEDKMIQASRRGCTLTELLDIAYPVIGLPLIILDNNEWMVAYSYDLEKYSNINTDFSDMLRFRSSSVEKIASFNREYNHYFKRDDVYLIPGDIFTNTGYAFNLYHGTQFAGILITDFFDTPITEGKLDLIRLLGMHIQDMLNDPASGLSIGSTELAFVHYLKYPSNDTMDDLVHELHISSWKNEDPMQMIYIAPASNTGLSPNLSHALIMFNRIFGVKAAEYMEGILLFANLRLLSENAGYESVLTKIGQLSYFAGVSSAFTDISRLLIMVRRALLALRQGDQNAGSINYFDDHFFKYFLSMIQAEDAQILAHPLPDRLKEYDKRHGSKLYDTLFIYLKNERSLIRTVQEMGIHRNTLIHRIERIEEIGSDELDQPETRLQILITYYMQQK